MEQDLKGLDYLKTNAIKEKKYKYDENKPFAFISYSHVEHDAQIVRNIFKKMSDKGYNLWIDVANIPRDENAWTEAAINALQSLCCKCAIFFRSENSMINDNILDEIDLIKDFEHINDGIIVVDIWESKNYDDAKTVYKKIINRKTNGLTEAEADKIKHQRKTCINLCKKISTECNAIRLRHEAGNDIDRAVDEIIEVLKYKLNLDSSDPIRIQEVDSDSEPKKKPTVIDDEPKPKIKGKNPLPIPNEPDPEPNPNPTGEVYYLITERKVCAVVKLDDHGYTLLKDSRIKKSPNNSIKGKAKAFFTEKSKLCGENRFITENITDEKPSSLAGTVFGGSENGNDMIKAAKVISKEEADKILTENAKLADQTVTGGNDVNIGSDDVNTGGNDVNTGSDDVNIGGGTVTSGTEVYYLITQETARAVIKYDCNNYTLLKNSKIKKSFTDKTPGKAKKSIEEKSTLYGENRLITVEITESASSPVAEVILGHAANGKEVLKKAKEISKKKADKILKQNKELTCTYSYTLYGREYNNNSSLYEMMETVFEEVLRHNPDKLANAEKCSSCLCYGDVIGKAGQMIDGKEVPDVFETGKAVNINGTTVSIGTNISPDEASALFYKELISVGCGENSSILKIVLKDISKE